MGWSCAKAASDTLADFSGACVLSTGCSNVWREGEDEYFFEHSMVEHEDGAITGNVFKTVNGNKARKVGSFRINGDGSISRAPKFLKKASEYVEVHSR